MARAIKKDQSKEGAQLELKQFQLSSLLEITQAINQNFSTEQLYSIYKFVLRTQLKIKKMALFVHDEDWSIPVSFGVEVEAENFDVKNFLEPVTQITSINETFPEVFQSFQTIIPVLHKNKPLAYTLIGEVAIGKLELKDDLIPFIQTLTNIISVANENKKFAKEQIRQQAIRIELALAAQMQTMLIPDDLPEDTQVEMFAKYLPHQEIGGDYYDYIKLNEEEFVFCMSDVSGKGIPAAMLMSNFQANLSALARIRNSLSQLVEELNEKVMDSARGEKFITLFLAKYNRNSRELSYINAGHNPPVIFSENQVVELSEGCTGLGMIDHLKQIKTGRMILKPGAYFLSYTDGVVETENEAGESYGLERLKNFFVHHIQHMQLKDFNEALIKDLTEFKGKMKFADDVTVLACRFK